MKASFRNILAALAVGASSFCVIAFDLPVKRVSGIDYYIYTVERNETLNDIAKKLGISQDDILRNNPAVENGVARGMSIFLPVKEFPENDTRLAGQSASDIPNAPTRYKVEKGQTLYGIARQFDVSPDDIIALNPSASQGVKSGQILYIPSKRGDINIAHRASEPPTVPKVIQSEQPAATHAEPAATHAEPELPTPADLQWKKNTAQNDVKHEEEIEEDEVVESIIYPAESNDTASVALLLPFMLNNDDNRTAKQSADFIRGFMLGAKSMSSDSFPCAINVFDTEGNPDIIQKLLTKPQVENADVIISHEEGPAEQLVPSFILNNENYCLNLFASHDSTYTVNPYMIQANTSAKIMYEKASQALNAAFPNHTPVFMIAKGGRGEKMPFVNYLKDKYSSRGIETIDLVFDGMLTTKDLENLDLSRKYVFIPVSGALSEFNKFSLALITLREGALDASDYAVFGYPDWTTFRNDPLDNMHRLEAVIYSRFFCDDSDAKTIRFNQLFESTYGAAPLEQVPSQALLGYDTARFILSNIKNNDGIFYPAQPTQFRGIQSTFLFEHPNDNTDLEAGYVNTALYIISYLPGGQISVQVL